MSGERWRTSKDHNDQDQKKDEEDVNVAELAEAQYAYHVPSFYSSLGNVLFNFEFVEGL